MSTSIHAPTACDRYVRKGARGRGVEGVMGGVCAALAAGLTRQGQAGVGVHACLGDVCRAWETWLTGWLAGIACAGRQGRRQSFLYTQSCRCNRKSDSCCSRSLVCQFRYSQVPLWYTGWETARDGSRQHGHWDGGRFGCLITGTKVGDPLSSDSALVQILFQKDDSCFRRTRKHR